MLEENYAGGEPDFLALTDIFAIKDRDDAIAQMILMLYEQSTSYPYPDRWLSELCEAYQLRDEAELMESLWMRRQLAYCKTLIFTSTRKGSTKLSTMTCDADKLRAMINADKKYTAEIILNATVTFAEDICADAEHFFKVELLDVTNDALLDAETIREYLSFVAPVEYSNLFSYREQIAKYAATLNFKITEYKIYVNGEQLVKNYRDTFTTKNGADKIFDLDFRAFRDDAGNLIAWSWIGLSKFKGIIQQTKTNPNPMRCIRLREVDELEEYRGRKFFTAEKCRSLVA